MTRWWVDDPTALEELAARLLSEPLLAFDTEFLRTGPEVPRVGLLQFAWPGGVALVDPLAVSLDPLGAVFDGPSIIIGHALAQDLEIVEALFGRPPRRVFDTQIAADFLGFRQVGFAPLVHELLGETLIKGAQRSNWFRRPLSEAQLRYAAQDVRPLLPLHATMMDDLITLERDAWAEEDSERLRTQGLQRPSPPSDAPAPEEVIAEVRARATELALPPGRLASRNDLIWWALGKAPDHLLTGWRHTLLGDLLASPDQSSSTL